MAIKRVGQQSLVYHGQPRIQSFAAIAGKKEGEGPLGNSFDQLLKDDLLGQESFEKAERELMSNTVKLCVQKANIRLDTVQVLIGGDLLNQIISAAFASRSLKRPFLGVYGACSTMAESLLIAGMMVDGGYTDNAIASTCSHFATAERQYRAPLELGGQRTPTAQWTVTGAGAVLVGWEGAVRLTGATIGCMIDMGVEDNNNMGAAMAPAAADTLVKHMNDFSVTPGAYDLIVTGDLGLVGYALMRELCHRQQVELPKDKYIDCGCEIFTPDQDTHAGGSGCGCSASVLCGWLLPRMAKGELKRVLFMATGALHSPTSSLQGDTIPGVAHAVVLEAV